MGIPSSRKSVLYKKQNFFCFIFKIQFTDLELIKSKTRIYYLKLISKKKRSELECNTVLCHKSIDYAGSKSEITIKY